MSLKNKRPSVLAIIPARKGSKRLPNKNILKLQNKPLIYWSIQAAKKSKLITNIVVSSDSEKVVKIAKKLNVNAVKRPNKLSLDNTPTIDTIKYTIKNIVGIYDYIILLQPTSPLRTNRHIDSAIKKLLYSKSSSLVSVSKEKDSESKYSEKNINKFLSKGNYKLNGAIYICNTKKLIINNSFFLKSNYSFMMKDRDSIDIDYIDDFKKAEKLFKKRG